jgi:hypothetical protein
MIQSQRKKNGPEDGFELGRIGKNSPFQKTENVCRVSQNDLAFLGRIGKPSLSEFPEIYGFEQLTFLAYFGFEQDCSSRTPRTF